MPPPATDLSPKRVASNSILGHERDSHFYYRQCHPTTLSRRRLTRERNKYPFYRWHDRRVFDRRLYLADRSFKLQFSFFSSSEITRDNVIVVVVVVVPCVFRIVRERVFSICHHVQDCDVSCVRFQRTFRAKLILPDTRKENRFVSTRISVSARICNIDRRKVQLGLVKKSQETLTTDRWTYTRNISSLCSPNSYVVTMLIVQPEIVSHSRRTHWYRCCSIELDFEKTTKCWFADTRVRLSVRASINGFNRLDSTKRSQDRNPAARGWRIKCRDSAVSALATSSRRRQVLLRRKNCGADRKLSSDWPLRFTTKNHFYLGSLSAVICLETKVQKFFGNIKDATII